MEQAIGFPRDGKVLHICMRLYGTVYLCSAIMLRSEMKRVELVFRSEFFSDHKLYYS